jgi:predicted nucleic acid-binding protein
VKFYLDASFLVALLVEESGSTAADLWWQTAAGDRIISSFAAAEVAAAISGGLRKRRFTEGQAGAALDDFDLLRSVCDPVVPGPEAFDLAETLVREFSLKLAAPDALHLASAMVADAALVTFDARLADAARATGAQVVQPSSA